MANRQKGEVSVELDGASYTLCMDMNAMALLEDHFSTPAQEVTFTDILAKIERNSMRHLRVWLWAAFQKHHPDLSQQAVNDLIQRHGGIFELSQQFLRQVNAATVPAPEDVKALRPKDAKNPRKAQARTAGTGPRSAFKRAASA